jgi:hypothetical protein
MRAVFELIDRHDALETVSGRDEDGGVAGEGAGIAGHADHRADLGGRKLPGLRFGPGAGRVQDDRVEALQFERQQRTAEEVAHLRPHRPEARRAARGPVERGERSAVAVDRMHLARLRETQGEGAASGEKVGDAARTPAALDHQG